MKGKSRPERVYALFGDAALAASSPFAQLCDAQATLLAAYREAQVEAAESALATVRALDLEARLAGVLALYADRLQAMRLSPAAQDWDGVFVADRK